MNLRVINSVDSFSEKTVLVRVDSDVDVIDSVIQDDTRLISSQETIEYILNRRGKIILVGHMGRPDGVRKKELSLLPVAQWYANKLQGVVQTQRIGEFDGWQINPLVRILENIRYFKNEEENDHYLSRQLAGLGDLFVNEAFAVSHRAHASTEGITHFLPSYAGIHLAREIKELTAVMNEPKRPLAVLIGGAKIETKLPLVERMHRVADFVLVGGEIAEQVKMLLKVQHEKITGRRSILLVADVIESGLDITEKSSENFVQVLQSASTIVWNGPMGLTGKDTSTEMGTKTIAQAIARSSAYTIVGGGDTLVYLRREKLLDSFGFISTGGGAMLEFLSGKKLPALVPLYKK